MSDESRPEPTYPAPEQDPPGHTKLMDPLPDHGEQTYQGANHLSGKVALITGADSLIGRAVAIAFAREGADVVISYLNEQEDAQETAEWVRKADKRALLVPGDIKSEDHCKELVAKAVDEFGRLDVLVNNAAFQRSRGSMDEISTDEWLETFQTNIHAMFFLCKATVPHMPEGGAIINTTSIQSRQPSPELLAYAAMKGAISNFTAGLAQMLAEKGIRVNAVAPGPIWTPHIPSTLPHEKAKHFGKKMPLARAGAYVLLASGRGSYMTGAVIPVTGGSIMIWSLVTLEYAKVWREPSPHQARVSAREH